MNLNFPNRFNEEFQKELEKAKFPTEKLSANWISFAMYSLQFASIIGLGCNPEDWKLLLEFGKCSLDPISRDLTLYQFALLSNNLQARTPRDLDMRLAEYCELMEEADQYVKIWSELTTELRKDVELRVAEEQQMREAHDKGGGLKPVKAEA